ncbi:MAG: glycosyltransferase [Alphaproteobacteria bacterium]|nr:glycosyltransferase [Alphaproteobacteria bacterium]
MKCLWLKIYFIFLVMLTFEVSAVDVGLKISAKEEWKTWGDYILGKDLEAGIKKNGHNVISTFIDDFYPKEHDKSKLDIYMHGFVPFNPPQNDNKINVLYLYYPLETANSKKYKNLKNVTKQNWLSLQTELWDFDLVAVASPTYQKEIDKLGIKTIFTPQFTNPEKFFYEFDENKSFDILFVGRPGYERISALWAIESGFDVALFGDGWQDKVDEKYFKGSYIDNNELHKYYASAKIVLNDTRNDMKKAGFISNRVFDVTASGGFLISDYMPEIEKFYGDSIPMFKTKEELKHLIDYYLSHPNERKEKALKAQQITLSNFTNEVIAKKMIDTVLLDKNKVIIKSQWNDNDDVIGDYWLGLDIEKGLKDIGADVKNYYKNNSATDDFYNNAGNLLYLQFKYNNYDFYDKNKAQIMYLYFPTFIPQKGKFINSDVALQYNTDVMLNNNLEMFDLIATPAKKVYNELKEKGYKTEFVTQFTNPDKFYYSFDEKVKSELLFVGSTWYERESVKYATELEYDVSVYGMNWKNKIDNKYIKGSYIDNRELNKYYSSAKIVLSDHAEDLEEMGLVINRLYDATACGAFVISEYSPYIEEIFGDSIPMFKSKEDFKALVDFYLANPDKRNEKAKKAQEITLNHHTNTVIAKKLKSLFDTIREEKK